MRVLTMFSNKWLELPFETLILAFKSPISVLNSFDLVRVGPRNMFPESILHLRVHHCHLCHTEAVLNSTAVAKDGRRAMVEGGRAFLVISNMATMLIKLTVKTFNCSSNR